MKKGNYGHTRVLWRPMVPQSRTDAFDTWLRTGLGFRPYNWFLVPVALLIAALLAVAHISFSSGVASAVNDVPGFQAINQFLIFPLFFLSGALYPIDTAPRVLQIIASLNPISYALRITLINQGYYGLVRDFIAIGITATILVAFGTYRFQKIDA